MGEWIPQDSDNPNFTPEARRAMLAKAEVKSPARLALEGITIGDLYLLGFKAVVALFLINLTLIPFWLIVMGILSSMRIIR